jgi:very-short-patch-repair endonuclease
VTEIFNRTSEKGRRRQHRHEMPRAEVLLWSRLKGKQLLGLKFRRQYSVGQYCLDLYCPAAKLAVEIDGDSHWAEGAVEYDRVRQSFIQSFGIHFLRFPNSEVYENLDGVVQVISDKAVELVKMKELPPPTPPSKGGE